jgi:sugar phosphate isomerase/epimerase
MAGSTVMGGLLLNTTGCTSGTDSREVKLPYKISLAQWSLNQHFFGRTEPHLDPMDFPKITRELGIEAVEYVNQFYMEHGTDAVYLKELKQRAEDHDITSVLIMCDREGHLGDPDDVKRDQAVENHIKWLEAAKLLGCHSIRVNAYSEGSYEEQKKLVVDGLSKMSEKAKPYDLNVIVENHGGYSSNGKWLLEVMQEVNLPNCGTLPDFGNFGDYDRYQGVRELMSYAKGVSAKSKFDSDGNVLETDYPRIMKIVMDAGYDGYVGIESGSSEGVDAYRAIQLTKKLLEDIRQTYMS